MSGNRVQYNYQTVSGDYKNRLHVMFGLNSEVLLEINRCEFDYLKFSYCDDLSEMAALELEALDIKCLDVSHCKRQKLDWISRLESLESISLNIPLSSKFDFSKLVKLKSFGSPYGKYVERLTSSEVFLKSFGTGPFKGDFSNFNESVKQTLEVLNVSISKGADLSGLESFHALRDLTISGSRELQDISPLLHCESLKRLTIFNCNKVDYKATLPKLSKLAELYYENKSVESLQHMPKNIEKLILSEHTIIEDQDVAVLLEFPKLKRVSFKKKRGYQYSGLEIQNILDSRSP